MTAAKPARSFLSACLAGSTMFYKTQCQFLAQQKEPTTGDVACSTSVQSGTQAPTSVAGIEVTAGVSQLG